jgi:hypothetical protein
MGQIIDKQRTIAEQSVYGDLKVLSENAKDEKVIRKVLIDSLCMSGDMPFIIMAKQKFDNCKPILRPLYWLTREITHEGYNDNQPFVPLIELAKKIHPEYKFEINNKGDKVIHYTSDHPYSDFIEIGFDKCLTYCYQVSGDFGYNAHYENIENITECYDLLNLWHFNYRNLPDTDFVSTEEVGDMYAVKTE